MEQIDLLILSMTKPCFRIQGLLTALLLLSLQAQASREYQNSLRKIARWVHKVVGKLDLTPSDSALALVLVAALQRKARRYMQELLCKAWVLKQATLKSKTAAQSAIRCVQGNA